MERRIIQNNIKPYAREFLEYGEQSNSPSHFYCNFYRPWSLKVEVKERGILEHTKVHGPNHKSN